VTTYDQLPWRTGRKVGRTIYAQVGPQPSDADVLIGLMDTPLYAELTCRDHNAALPPPVGWPHPLPLDQMAASPRKVFAHYVPSLPISVDNKPPNVDYYQTQYLTPGGEGGKHKAYGGWMRDRPLGRDPYPAGVDWLAKDAETEVANAAAYGIDGFTVNLFNFPGEGSDAGTKRNARVVQCLLDAANNHGGFTVCLMPDMTSGPGRKTADELAAAIAKVAAANPACYRLDDGRLVVAPFHAETHPVDWWKQFLLLLTGTYNTPVAFWPLFLSATAHIDEYAPIAYGITEWGTRDPTGSSPTGSAARIKAARAKGLKWMQPVSVQDERPREGRFWEAQNTGNLRTTWQIAIDNDADAVQLITWNDHTEGTANQPSMQHGRAFLDVSSYYAAWYKLGTPPTILQDAVILTHRQQPWQAKPSYPETKLMKNAGQTPPGDVVEALSFLTAPALVTIDDLAPASAPAGVSATVAVLVTGSVSAEVTRDGKSVASVTSPYPVTDKPVVQDLGYVAASSLP